MSNVIEIRFSEDLSEGKPRELGRLLNEMRYRMEMARWRKKWYRAQERQDWDAMMRLDQQYEMVGLP